MAGQRELILSRVAERVSVLGPGLRAAVWVQGCPLRCPGCVSPEGLPFDGGERWTAGPLAARLLALPADITGVTFSGGEPMAQAAGLAALVRLLRERRDWSVMCYTGFTLEHLLSRGDAAQRDLLGQTDILVDGPYLERRHADLLWRGSDNQRLRFLTSRHTMPGRDRGAGMEFGISGAEVIWTGVPPVPGFRAAFERTMAGEGVILTPDGQRRTADVTKP